MQLLSSQSLVFLFKYNLQVQPAASRQSDISALLSDFPPAPHKANSFVALKSVRGEIQDALSKASIPKSVD